MLLDARAYSYLMLDGSVAQQVKAGHEALMSCEGGVGNRNLFRLDGHNYRLAMELGISWLRRWQMFAGCQSFNQVCVPPALHS